MKIVTPNSKSTDENKENIQQTAGTSKGEPMDVSESGSAAETTKGSEQSSANPNPNAAEAEMVSDVDCSISENDWIHINPIYQRTSHCSFFLYYFGIFCHGFFFVTFLPLWWASFFFVLPIRNEFLLFPIIDIIPPEKSY